jgi:putative membrane protein insertion efficiency factor
MMKGPATLRHESMGQKQLETSAVKLVLQAGIKLFQKRVSPIDGPRCGFHPTCSSFGLTAINRHGAVTGAIMTADRLIRCNPWKRVGGTYESLQNGKLSDPVGDNVFSK